MPINERYNVIFVHIPKNGGTSVEYALGMHGGIDYIGIKPYLNQETNKYLFGAGAQEFSAAELKKIIGEAKYNKFKSFAISRNPYTRYVSYVSWKERLWPTITSNILEIEIFEKNILDDFKNYKISKFENLYLKPQHTYIFDQFSNQLVNKIFKIEEFDQVTYFIKKITNNKELKIEKRMSSNHYEYDKYYDQNSINIINEMYRDDFNLLSYDFL